MDFSEEKTSQEQDVGETASVISIPPTLPGWEWKLFDFKEEEQEPKLPDSTKSAQFGGLRSPMILPKPTLQPSNSIAMLLSSPILSPILRDGGNSRPLPSPVLKPRPINEQIIEESDNRITTMLYSPRFSDNRNSLLVASPVASPVLRAWPKDKQVEEKSADRITAIFYSPKLVGNRNLQPLPSPVLRPWPMDIQTKEESADSTSSTMLYSPKFSDNCNLQPLPSPVLRPWPMDVQVEEV